MTDMERWERDGKQFKWELPEPAAWPWRLSVIRHIRAAWHASRAESHYAVFASLGMARSGYDEWVIYAIRRGLC